MQKSKILSHTLSHDKSKSSDDSNSESENEKQNIINMPKKKHSESTSQNQENLIQHNKHTEEINTLKYKRRKIEQKKSIDDTFVDISNQFVTFLENSKENATDNVKTPDQSFAEYVRSHLEHISEPEKTARKKLILDALTTPLQM